MGEKYLRKWKMFNIAYEGQIFPFFHYLKWLSDNKTKGLISLPKSQFYSDWVGFSV